MPMAATMMTIPAAGIQALEIPGQQKQNLSVRANRWSPLLGAEPDYMDERIDLSQSVVQSGGGNQDRKAVLQRSRLVLTGEKAKQLRKMTREAEAFHDVMYHSAVASRLALDSSSSAVAAP